MVVYRNIEHNRYYTEGRVLTWQVDEHTVFSGIPTAGQLSEWGFVEYEQPVYTPAEADIKQQRMNEILSLLADTDYIVLKKAEGIDISSYNEQYDGDFLAWRQSLRDEYNQLEETLNTI